MSVEIRVIFRAVQPDVLCPSPLYSPNRDFSLVSWQAKDRFTRQTNKTRANVCILLHKGHITTQKCNSSRQCNVRQDLLLAVFNRGTEVWEMSLG